MSTIRDQIIDAAVAALNTGTPVGVPQCVRTLQEPKEAGQLPALIVFPIREEVNDASTGRWGPIVTRALTLRFVGFAFGDPVDSALDPITEWLSKLGGQNFGGLVNNMVEAESNWNYSEADHQYAAVTVDFRAEYQTRRDDASLKQ